MYGNEGEAWIMTKVLSMEGLKLENVGQEYKIAPYHSVPHGYASIEHGNISTCTVGNVFKAA